MLDEETIKARAISLQVFPVAFYCLLFVLQNLSQLIDIVPLTIMKHVAFLLYLVLVLLMQISPRQALPMSLSSDNKFQDDLLPSWYEAESESEQQHPSDRQWKRRFHDLLASQRQRQRRFGNTRYGRSLSAE